MAIESGGTLAHYRLIEKIGEGGMGVVWRAVDTTLDREVAIKILARELSEESHRLTRFQREAKLLASINHPNIATIYGIHEQDDTRFLAMELIPGEDLARRLERGPLGLADALSAARQIAAALEATHERGVIHRDLKPANIHLTPGGEVKVLDFGIARDMAPAEPGEEARDETRPGVILGTVSYMSPEQARGKPLDARTDLWSLGCVLYQMLAGRPPFSGETRWDKLAALLREEPDWNALPERTPASVRDLLRGCLDKSPERRPGGAGEVRRTLDAALAAMTTPEEVAPPREPSAEGPSARRARFWIVAAIVVVGAVLLIWGLRGAKSPAPADEVAAADRRSVAVLPFRSMGGGEENDVFAAGIHDDVLNRIAKIGDLKVISRTSVQEYGETSKTMKQIGEELGVAAVLEGSVYRAGDQVRINVQLIDAASDETLWAESYDRELTLEEIFGIQGDIAERIAGALQATLSADERRRIGALPTDDLGAYELYLQGIELLARTEYLEEDFVRARAVFEQAVSRDPTFALAYAGLSEAALNHYWLAGGPREAREAAGEAARRAVELSPELPEAHMALGTYLYLLHDYGAALEELSIAERGLPGNAELHRWKGYMMRRRGRWEEGLSHLERARSLDPREPIASLELGFTLMHLRRYDEALGWFEESVALAPEFPAARLFRAMVPVLRDGTLEAAAAAADEIEAIRPIPRKYSQGWQVLLCLRDYDRVVSLLSESQRVTGQWHDYPTSLLVGWTYRLEGRDEDAAREFDTARKVLEEDLGEHPQDVRLHGALGVTYAGLGRKEEALREGRRAVELLPMDRDVFIGGWQLQDLAWIYVMTGEHDAAVETFEQLLTRPSAWSIELFLLDPRIDPLRDHAGFRDLVDRLRAARPAES
jgi:TolB-like protein/Flp pilus assembly protein TadD